MGSGCQGVGPCQALAAEGGGRKARLYKGPSVLGYNRHQRTDGLRFKTSGSREASCRGAQSPIRNSIKPKNWIFNPSLFLTRVQRVSPPEFRIQSQREPL